MVWAIIVLSIVVLSQAFAGCGESRSAGADTVAAPAAVEESPQSSPEEVAEQQSRDAAAEKAAAEKKAAEKAAAEEADRKAAEEAAAAEAALKDPASYAAISARDWQLVAKDPASHAGEQYVIYGHVTQADAATGTDGFRANTGGEQREQWYEYDTNTIVVAEPEVVKQVVTNDLVRMYVSVVGSYEYSNVMGGSTTAVSVQANVIDNLGTTN